jgi:hypothetical protein
VASDDSLDCAFIRGARGAVVTVSMSSAWKTASKDSVYLPSRSRIKNRTDSRCTPAVQRQPTGALAALPAPGPNRLRLSTASARQTNLRVRCRPGCPASRATQGCINDKSTARVRHAGKQCSSTTTPSAQTSFSLAWHTFSSAQASANSLPAALQSRIQRSRPGSALSAGRRQGALPPLDAGPYGSQRPHVRTACGNLPTRITDSLSAPVAWGARHCAPTPKGGREPTRGSYASRCREHPNRSGDIGGPWLTTARVGAVRRCRSTGSGDGRIGHR